MGRIAGAVGFAEGVPAGDQGHGLLVVHGHAAEGFANVAGSLEGIRIAVGALGIDVNQPHLHRAEGIVELAVAAIPLVVEPFALDAPIDVVFRFVDVLATAGEAKGLKAHGLQGDIAGEHHKIGPRELAAVLLLDRPQQAARFVQITVIRPAVEGGETQLAGARAAAAVADAVGAGDVPGHADEERAVVAVVGRPPVLRIRHHRFEILLHRGEVEALEFLGVIEVPAHRVGRRGILMENFEVELVGPPVFVRPVAHRGIGARVRALTCTAILFSHDAPRTEWD